jgi:hypothetical protein
VANRLARETSAYLRQHAENPVDWHPWGADAFERARREDKPVLVSIGYSSCHWCHVMEHESFEDPAAARLMNDLLVSIKVDREERPDVDQVYMDTVVRLTGSGGWPLNVFCTPDGRPFHGGTYFPPKPAYGRPSWSQVVESVARVWREQRGDVEAQSRRILAALEARPEPARGVEVGAATLRDLCMDLLARADQAHGGFGDAPKFPTPTNLEAILAASARRAAPTGALEHVVFTLERMARGGIYDQLGGGFHRYSTDARWLVPHFEKMLYDQGQLLRVYAEAYRQTRDAKLAWPIAEAIEFMERELRDPAGFFWASLDADSEGEEGRYYVWTPAQLAAVLGAEAGAEFAAAYGVEPRGNFEHTGASVLAHGLAGERPRFARERASLLEARAKRVRPATDRKGIASWNAYAISGLASAGAALDRPEWVASAARAAGFVLERMCDADGRLLRIFDGERARVPAFLDDHAALLAALLDLARAGGPQRCPADALSLAEAIRARFWDAEARTFRFAPLDGERLFYRAASDGDGATPAAAGLAALGLVRIAELSGRADLADLAAQAIAAEAPIAARVPLAHPTLLRAAALREHGLGVALVIGRSEDPATRALARRARELLASDDAVVVLSPGERPAWLAPAWLEGREPVGGRPTAWLCRGRVCSLPATEPEGLSLP